MVHVSIVADGAEGTVADAIRGWAYMHPGDEDLVVQIVAADSRIPTPAPWWWEGDGGVSQTLGDLQELAAAVGEHAISYDIQYQVDGQGVHGVGKHAPHGGHRYISPLSDPHGWVAGEDIGSQARRLWGHPKVKIAREAFICFGQAYAIYCVMRWTWFR